MSQAGLNAPTVISNSVNNKQQVPLRDYLNARIAPFLKKAITESLDAEAEFPLQWLGECLIHQSVLYEGNPDQTNIRERFLYKFDEPKQQQEQSTSQSEANPADGPTAAVPVQPQPESTTRDTNELIAESAPTVEAGEIGTSSTAGVTQAPVVNGVSQETQQDALHGSRDDDTDMGGTV